MLSRIMSARITQQDLTGLNPRYTAFVIEYVKDFNAQRASEVAGYGREHGYNLLKDAAVNAAIERVLVKRRQASDITAEWALMEAVDNHRIARQERKYSASNTALALVMKHAAVDAFAAEKVIVAADEEIRDRLLRGRNRANKNNQPKPELSFL